MYFCFVSPTRLSSPGDQSPSSTFLSISISLHPSAYRGEALSPMVLTRERRSVSNFDEFICRYIYVVLDIIQQSASC